MKNTRKQYGKKSKTKCLTQTYKSRKHFRNKTRKLKRGGGLISDLLERFFGKKYKISQEDAKEIVDLAKTIKGTLKTKPIDPKEVEKLLKLAVKKMKKKIKKKKKNNNLMKIFEND